MEWLRLQRFDQGYLFLAGLILAFTGLGKVPTDFILKLCIEEPMMGDYQPLGLSNMGLSGLAAGIELSIVALICLSPVRWLPCLASCLWGTLCLALRLLVFKVGFAHCNCLGWVDAPPLTVEVIAAWLSLGGGIAFWQSWHNPESAAGRLAEQKRTRNIFRRLLWWGIGGACVVCGLQILLHPSNYDEYKELHGPLYLVVATPLIAAGLVAGIQGGFTRAPIFGIFRPNRLNGIASQAEFFPTGFILAVAGLHTVMATAHSGNNLFLHWVTATRL